MGTCQERLLCVFLQDMKTPQPLPSTIHICEAGAEDAGIIVHLIRQLTTEGEESSPVTEAYVLHYLSGTDRKILLARRQNKTEGLLSYSVRPDLFHAGSSVLIEELVVDEEARGQGLGSALMQALLERAQQFDCRELCLAVMPENEGAIRFYKRHGLAEEALFLERHFP